MTKDRVGAGLAVVAAIIGLVLVFTYRDAGADENDDDNPAAPPSTSQVVPAVPGGQVQQPGQVQVPGQPVAPAQPQPDNDGDDDDDG